MRAGEIILLCVLPLIFELYDFLSSTLGNSETSRRINNLFKRKYHSIFKGGEGKFSQRTWILLRETFTMATPPTSSSFLPRISCPQLAHCLPYKFDTMERRKKARKQHFQREMRKFNCRYLESRDKNLDKSRGVIPTKLGKSKIQIFLIQLYLT